MKHITFRKLFERVERGMCHEALIVYEGRERLFMSRQLTPEEAKDAGFQVHGWCIEKIHFLRIDLWLFILQFEYVQKNIPEPKLKKI